MANIEKLLSQTSWTGREIGILTVTGMARAFRQSLNGEAVTELIPQEKLRAMVNGIVDKENRRDYNGYVAIHEWLTLNYNIAQTHLQQAQFKYQTIWDYLQQAMMVEDTYDFIGGLPRIMAEDEYEAEREFLKSTHFFTPDHEERVCGIFDMFLKAYQYYLDLLHQAPRKKNPLKEIRKAYSSQPLKSLWAIGTWQHYNRDGYYTLPDGRRSDQMTREEFDAATVTPKMKELRKKRENAFLEARYMDVAKLMFHGSSEAEAEAIRARRDIEDGFIVSMEWHYYDRPSKEVSLWDFCDSGLLDKSYGRFNDRDLTEICFLDLCKQFTDLVVAVFSDMDEKYGEALGISFSSIPIKDWEDTGITARQIYEVDFYGERSRVEDDRYLFSLIPSPENDRAVRNGIAILRSRGDVIHISEQEHYSLKELQASLQESSLEAFFPESEDCETNRSIVRIARREMIQSLATLTGFNLALDMIAKKFDIPDISVFKMPVEAIQERIVKINQYVPLLYRRITETAGTDGDLQARKMRVLQEFFYDLPETISIPAENIKKAKALFKNYAAFSSERHLFSELLYQPGITEKTKEGETA